MATGKRSGPINKAEPPIFHVTLNQFRSWSADPESLPHLHIYKPDRRDPVPKSHVSNRTHHLDRITLARPDIGGKQSFNLAYTSGFVHTRV